MDVEEVGQVVHVVEDLLEDVPFQDEFSTGGPWVFGSIVPGDRVLRQCDPTVGGL